MHFIYFFINFNIYDFLIYKFHFKLTLFLNIYYILGDFIVSGSMDHTAKLFDVSCGKRRQTFKGHKDSVNTVKF